MIDPLALAIKTGFNVGVYDDLDEEIYHRVEAISYSGAKKLLRSAAHYKFEREFHAEPKESMVLGSAVGYGILQPHLWANVLKAPKFDRRTKDGKLAAEAFEKEAAGKLVLDPDQYDAALQMIESVQRHPAASRLLTEGRPEVSMMWVDGRFGVPCRGRFDWLRNDFGIIDLKTTRDASPEAFGKQAANLMYHVQAAAYGSAMEHLLNRSPEFFVWVCVENEPPYLTATYIAESNQILAGIRLWDQALARYRTAVETGVWEGYPPTIEPLPFPKWALTFSA